MIILFILIIILEISYRIIEYYDNNEIRGLNEK